jgi:hypothetical protein
MAKPWTELPLAPLASVSGIGVAVPSALSCVLVVAL